MIIQQQKGTTKSLLNSRTYSMSTVDKTDIRMESTNSCLNKQRAEANLTDRPLNGND